MARTPPFSSRAIVAYHAIDERPGPISTTARQLETDLRRLREAGCVFVSMDAVADWLAGTVELPPGAIAVTFDDGYQSAVRRALPILHRLAVPATIYVVAGRLGSDNAWPGQWRSIPTLPLMTEADVREAAIAGVSIGSHTWSHLSLPGLSDAALHSELTEAEQRLQALIGGAVRHLAFPYGHRGDREIDMARQRYRTAVSATPKPLSRRARSHDLPRLDPHDLRLALQMGLVSDARLAPYLGVRRTARRLRRAIEALDPFQH
jgi:peptidoglycan/xylan/chitin deacetylase (PgdA/CDA1 family)